jgi:hypothetical protein
MVLTTTRNVDNCNILLEQEYYINKTRDNSIKIKSEVIKNGLEGENEV